MDAVEPSEFQLGFACYGRGYIFSDQAYLYAICGFSGSSKTNNCTTILRAFSLRETLTIVDQTGLQREIIPDTMAKSCCTIRVGG